MTQAGSGAPKSAAVNEALTAIAAFEQSSAPGLWPALDKKTILAEMRQRIQNPFLINQGAQPFCGPTAILFELVRKQPVRYVQICRSLYEMGFLKGATKHIEAPAKLRQDSKGNLRTGQADWMVLATLRDAESLIFPVDPDAPKQIRGLSGMSFSWEMKGWIEEILGYNQIIYNKAFRKGDLLALKDAANSVKIGGVAFPLINARTLYSIQSTTETSLLSLDLPNHWIALLGNLVNANGRVAFDTYTWGKQIRIDVSESTFKEGFWGVVIGLP